MQKLFVIGNDDLGYDKPIYLSSWLISAEYRKRREDEHFQFTFTNEIYNAALSYKESDAEYVLHEFRAAFSYSPAEIVMKYLTLIDSFHVIEVSTQSYEELCDIPEKRKIKTSKRFSLPLSIYQQEIYVERKPRAIKLK